MRILALVRRKTEHFTDDQIAQYLEPEAERVRKLYMDGVMRWVASRGDTPGAVVELECADVAEARAILDTLPFAQQGMVDIDIVPLLPYRGFAPRG
jgi:hypothetical protein